MIKKIKGNIVQLAAEGSFDILIHGCNCFCDMSKGLNRDIVKAFPEVRVVDAKTAIGDVYKLGDYTLAHIKNKRLKIVNMYTQYEPGLNFEYTALGIGLRQLASVLNGDEIIGMPLIGSGLNKGTSKEIEKIIAKELDTFNVIIVIP